MTPTRLRIFCSLFFIVAVVAALAASGSSRAIGERGGGSSFRLAAAASTATAEHDGLGQVDVSVAAAPTPPPCNGQLITILNEDFEDVMPPVLPAGWTAINVIDPDGILWQTSNSGVPIPPADTLPNAAWVNDPAVISDKYLDAPGVDATESWYVTLTFRHNFNLEASDVDPNLGFDGGVLEFSMDGGQTFQDITTWGSFVTGGYNRTISADRGSPIAGRQAWSGNSQGFITTTVELPPELFNAVLRWRMASDSSGSSEGWRVDTTNIVWCHFSGTPSPTPTLPPTPTATPTATATATLTPTPTSTATPTPTGTASPRVTPRPRPMPHPRPSPP
jgi:hypothetical protein